MKLAITREKKSPSLRMLIIDTGRTEEELTTLPE